MLWKPAQPPRSASSPLPVSARESELREELAAEHATLAVWRRGSDVPIAADLLQVEQRRQRDARA